MNRIAGRSRFVLILAAVLVLGLVIFSGEYLFQAKEWVVFPGSPHVYRGSNLNCGVVTDRTGAVLLDATDGRTYSDDRTVRLATLHLLGDREGYISAPAVSEYSSQMVGFDLINGVYSTSGTGGTAVLTISAKAQKAALEALDGRKGVVGVYNYKTGEILCAVSSPTYDPDDVPDLENDSTGDYEGVYVNRFTQASYVPGSIFKVVTTAAALAEIDDIESQTFLCEGSYWVGGDEVVCEGTHGEVTMRQALMHSCNSAFAQIALELGPETLMKYAQQFQITEPLTFDGITTLRCGRCQCGLGRDWPVHRYGESLPLYDLHGPDCRRWHSSRALSRILRFLWHIQPVYGQDPADRPRHAHGCGSYATGNDALQRDQ